MKQPGLKHAQRQRDAALLELVHGRRPQAGRTELADDLPVALLVLEAEAEKILSDERTYAVGKPLDISFTAVDGRKVDLKQMKGKVVLVEFWATWCGPCRGEIPGLVKAYEKYHAKGFDVLGISLDQEGKVAVRSMLDDRGGDDRPMPGLEENSHVDKLSRPKFEVIVGEGCFEADGSGGGVNLVVDDGDLALAEQQIANDAFPIDPKQFVCRRTAPKTPCVEERNGWVSDAL